MEVETENNQILPVEIREKVFGYLSHNEKLISRLVCKEWNIQISTDLAKTTYFDMTSKEKHEILLGATVPYSKIRVGDYSSSGFPLPQEFQDHVTSLQLNISGLEDCMKAVVRFPLLTSLDLKIIEYRNREDSNNTNSNSDQSPDLEAQFKECMGRLKTLSIRFTRWAPQNVLYTVLNGFSHWNLKTSMSLTELSIKEEQQPSDSGPTFLSPKHLQLIMLQIFRIINYSCGTLISLGIDLISEPILESFFSDLIPKLFTLGHLQLETVKICAEPSEVFEDSDFLNLQNFIKRQVKIRKVTLPWSCKTSLSLPIEFLDSLPEDMESIDRLIKDHVNDEFFSNFPKLEHMSIMSFKELMFKSNTPCPNIRRLDFTFRGPYPTFLDRRLFYRNLGNSLVNLAELRILSGSLSDYMFNSSDLQRVIEYLKQLRVLEVDNCERITDGGLTGIALPYIDNLLYTRRVYLCPEVPKEKIDGLPLCSLKFLEKLVLVNARITDCGIYYGLQFGPQLKHLTLSVRARMDERDVTDWGLHWLATSNPGLEEFYVALTEGRFSENGIEDVKRQLPLVKSTGKFKLVKKIEKYK